RPGQQVAARECSDTAQGHGVQGGHRNQAWVGPRDRVPSPMMADAEFLPSGHGALPLTPSAFLEALAARLDRLHGADAVPALVRGVPVKTGAGKDYGGSVYAQIRDPRTTESIDARIPVQLAAGMQWNQEAVFIGLIHFKSRRGELRAEFRVDDVREAGALHLPSKDELLERWAAAVARPKQDVRAALLGERRRVVLISGMGSVAVDDVRAQLREAEADLDLQLVRVSMHRPGEVARAIRQAAGAQAVALTRGGGQTVHDLDDEELIGAGTRLSPSSAALL